MEGGGKGKGEREGGKGRGRERKKGKGESNESTPTCTRKLPMYTFIVLYVLSSPPRLILLARLAGAKEAKLPLVFSPNRWRNSLGE